MADWFDGNEQEIDFTPQRRGSRPLLTLLSLVIIVGLLGTGIYSLVWFINRDLGLSPFMVANTGSAPAFSPNRIAYINPEGQVVTVAPDGRDPRILTQDDLDYIFPVWSPDGRYLAAIGSQESSRGVYLLQDAAAQTSAEVYASSAQGPIYLYWSPDGRQVSFLATQSRGGLGLFVAGVASGDAARLIMTGSPFYWDWAADSTRVLIHTGFAGEQARLGMLEVASQSFAEELGSPGFFQAPGISADGRFRAYAQADENGDSWLVVSSSDGETVVREPQAGLMAMSWHPANNQLAFISAARNNGRFFGPLRLLDVDGGETAVLTNETALAFFWSPDGRYLAVIHVGILNGNEIFAAEDARKRLGKPAPQRFEPPQLSLAIWDVAEMQLAQSLTFRPTERFFTQFLPFFDQYALSHRLWSPQSDALALPMMADDGRAQVMVVSVADGRQRVLGDGDMPFWSP